MTAFRFPLERVLQWRESELSREEARLEQLQAELRRVNQAIEGVHRSRAEAQNALANSAAVQGSELAALEIFRAWAIEECARLKRRADEGERAIAAQKLVVTESRRRVRLVERLKERRREEWQSEFDREADTEAGEFAVAQWRRKHEGVHVLEELGAGPQQGEMLVPTSS